MASVRQFPRSVDLGARLRNDMEVAGLGFEPERLAMAIVVVAAIPWLAFIIVVRPEPPIVFVALIASLATTAFVAHSYLQHCRNARVNAFRSQLEGALRTLAGGVRVGLGIRQALVLTAELCREPAKSEFMRVVGLSNV